MRSYNEGFEEPPADTWEAPEHFWQILHHSGYVTNVSDETYETMKMVTAEFSEPGFYEVKDIYGDEAMIKCESIIAIKHWTKTGGARWKRYHQESEREY